MALLLSLLLAGPALASTAQSSSRKSLSFGPVLPHAQFVTNPSASSSFTATSAPSTDPKEIALNFVNQLAQQYQTTEDNGHSFFLREDSYTDSTSGVSHIYVRQLVQGIEVADGNINLNIYNGKVISYGDSVSIPIVPFADACPLTRMIVAVL